MVAFFGLYSIPWVLLGLFKNSIFLGIIKFFVYLTSPYKVLESCKKKKYLKFFLIFKINFFFIN